MSIWMGPADLSGIGLTGSQVEGPMWMKFDTGNRWALYLDQYASGRGYMPVVTTDPADPGSYQVPTSGTYNMGGTRKRHGWVLNVTAAEESRVLARWPNSPANRVQSFNFQDRYVRHINFDARIDPNVSPADDSRFRPRPGLAGTGTVSFESVDFPDTSRGISTTTSSWPTPTAPPSSRRTPPSASPADPGHPLARQRRARRTQLF